jgi:phosphoribosylamine---glycine ligase
VVTAERADALGHARQCLGLGGQVVVEEYLDGPEVSLFVITDGRTAVPMLPAQDHKRVGDGDTGPNTGGMGAYTPLTWADPGLVDAIMAQVAEPTIAEMARRGTPFAGVLYCGLALTTRGLRVVEFNARFGDPEIQAVLRLLATPLAGFLLAAATGRLAEVGELQWRPGAAVCVVIAAQGYPGDVITGDPVEGTEAADAIEGVSVVHAGTKRDAAGAVVTGGGRVLSVTAVGADVAEALRRAYAGVAAIDIRGSHHRTDIAAQALG